MKTVQVTWSSERLNRFARERERERERGCGNSCFGRNLRQRLLSRLSLLATAAEESVAVAVGGRANFHLFPPQRSLASRTIRCRPPRPFNILGAEHVASQVPERERERGGVAFRQPNGAKAKGEIEMTRGPRSRKSIIHIGFFRTYPFVHLFFRVAMLLGWGPEREPMITAKSIPRLGRQKGRIAFARKGAQVLCSCEKFQFMQSSQSSGWPWLLCSVCKLGF